jgi:hypothetical protein
MKNGQVGFVNLVEKGIRSSANFRTVDNNVVYLSLSDKILLITKMDEQLEIPFRQMSMFEIPFAKKIRIEKSGAFYDTADTRISGYWEYQKLADLLPFDYTSL